MDKKIPYRRVSKEMQETTAQFIELMAKLGAIHNREMIAERTRRGMENASLDE